jgi:glycerol-3-phosphate O-acyltransferase / dihydroxyacetone phosphate acyltransferase
MWLLPAFSAVARLAMRTYYRLEVVGARIPAGGPVLIVANHPNSLLDPALVVAVAGRPVRFLAKAPLFTDPLVGWLVRGAGAIPVHRRQDDAAMMQHNADTFAAAHASLADGAAIGIFPEGLSHDEPALAPLRTGAARIALGAALRTAAHIRIIPIGLTFREKQTFRTGALVVTGQEVEWGDLAGEGEAPDAVRELTARIELSLRTVTVNLERWEDVPLVETAEAIHAAELGGGADAAERITRIRVGARRLAELRRSGDDRVTRLAGAIERHRRLLARLGIAPHELHRDARLGDAAWWAVRTIPALTMLALLGGLIGGALFWLPYRLTGVIEKAMNRDVNVRATTKLLVGALLHVLWIAGWAAVAAWYAGFLVAGFVAVLLPLLGVAALLFHDRWDDTRRDVRRFLLRRSRRRLIDELRTRQTVLAERIDVVVRESEPGFDSRPNRADGAIDAAHPVRGL